MLFTLTVKLSYSYETIQKTLQQAKQLNERITL